MRYLVWLVTFSSILFAHPHVFVDAHVDVQSDKILLVFSFDEMTSSMLMSDYDKNKDKKLDDKEIAFNEKRPFQYVSAIQLFLSYF